MIYKESQNYEKIASIFEKQTKAILSINIRDFWQLIQWYLENMT